MLDDKICKMREKLNKSIAMEEDYEIIYNLSVELDELIAEHYRKCNESNPSNIEGENENTEEIAELTR